MNCAPLRPPTRCARHGLCRVAALGALVAMVVPASAQPLTASAAALGLRDATPPAQRAALMQPFTLEARSDWHYTPRRRAGLAWKEMSGAQRTATTELLRSALNESGLDKVRAVMALEIALRELETFGSATRSRELRGRALRRAECQRQGLGLAHRRPSPVAALDAAGRPLRRHAAAVLRRQSRARAARLRPGRARGNARARPRGRPGPCAAVVAVAAATQSRDLRYPALRRHRHAQRRARRRTAAARHRISRRCRRHNRRSCCR